MQSYFIIQHIAFLFFCLSATLYAEEATVKKNEQLIQENITVPALQKKSFWQSYKIPIIMTTCCMAGSSLLYIFKERFLLTATQPLYPNNNSKPTKNSITKKSNIPDLYKWITDNPDAEYKETAQKIKHVCSLEGINLIYELHKKPLKTELLVPDDIECSICKDKDDNKLNQFFICNGTSNSTDCAHYMHIDCLILSFIHINNKCPECFKSLDGKDDPYHNNYYDDNIDFHPGDLP